MRSPETKLLLSIRASLWLQFLYVRLTHINPLPYLHFITTHSKFTLDFFSVSLLCCYLLVKYRHQKRRKYLQLHRDHVFSSKAEQAESGCHEKLDAVEWLHASRRRFVKVRFCPDGKIQVDCRKGERLRTIDTDPFQAMMVETTTDPTREPMALLRIPREYDLVLVFEDMALRAKFLKRLREFLKAESKDLVETLTTHEHLAEVAETKEKRKQRLEKFFKIAYGRVNNFFLTLQKEENPMVSIVIFLQKNCVCILLLGYRDQFKSYENVFSFLLHLWFQFEAYSR